MSAVILNKSQSGRYIFMDPLLSISRSSLTSQVYRRAFLSLTPSECVYIKERTIAITPFDGTTANMRLSKCRQVHDKGSS